MLNSAGEIVSGAGGYYGGGVYFPVAIAADADGNVWTANYGDSTASLLSGGGEPISGSGGFGAGELSGPVAEAIDADRNAWFADQSSDSGSVTGISANGSQVTTTICGGAQTSGIATDAIGMASHAARGHVWTANFQSSSVSELELSNDGAAVAISTGYTGGGLDDPSGIAIDGAGRVWVANFDGNSITELAGAASASPGRALSPAGGLGRDAHLGWPDGIAIDASGNVWVSNFGLSTITEFPGAASPVKTPLAGPAQLP